MAAAPAVFEPFLLGCIPDQAGLFGVGTSQTDPSIAYIPYIRGVLSFCGALGGSPLSTKKFTSLRGRRGDGRCEWRRLHRASLSGGRIYRIYRIY